MGAGAIQNRLEQGRLIRVHAGVYALDYRRPEPIARAAAAVLACGPAAVLSHQSAAALWGLGRWPAVPEVTTTAHIRRPAIRAHRSRAVGPRDATVQLGIRVTTPARTLRDLKPRLSKARYTRAVNDARVKHILGDDDAERLLGHRRGPTRSEFEDAFQAFVTRYRLPPPLINTTLHGFEVDVLFPMQRVIVELDGWDFHRSRSAFADDRERDATHLAGGHPTVRITWERLRDEPRREASRLQRILDDRPPAS